MRQETPPGYGRILGSRKRTAFAGMCVLLMMSWSLVGMSVKVAGEQTDLATAERALQWRVEDVFLQPSGYWGWHNWKPEVVDPGFNIPLNDLASDTYTVYVHNSWEGNLQGMEIVAKTRIDVVSGEPQFVTRVPDTTAFVRLEFQSTPSPYDVFDY